MSLSAAFQGALRALTVGDGNTPTVDLEKKPLQHSRGLSALVLKAAARSAGGGATAATIAAQLQSLDVAALTKLAGAARTVLEHEAGLPSTAADALVDGVHKTARASQPAGGTKRSASVAAASAIVAKAKAGDASTVGGLKIALKARGLKVSGNKGALEARLAEALAADGAAATVAAAEQSDDDQLGGAMDLSAGGPVKAQPAAMMHEHQYNTTEADGDNNDSSSSAEEAAPPAPDKKKQKTKTKAKAKAKRGSTTPTPAAPKTAKIAVKKGSATPTPAAAAAKIEAAPDVEDEDEVPQHTHIDPSWVTDLKTPNMDVTVEVEVNLQ